MSDTVEIKAKRNRAHSRGFGFMCWPWCATHRPDKHQTKMSKNMDTEIKENEDHTRNPGPVGESCHAPQQDNHQRTVSKNVDTEIKENKDHTSNPKAVGEPSHAKQQGNNQGKVNNNMESRIKNNNNYTKLSTSNPSVYLLNLKDTGRADLCIKDFGCPNFTTPNKTIMLLGATGSGKTTLINGMINYILGVEWSDTCRLKLIDEQTNKTQAESQTSDVTTYRLHHQNNFQVPYSVTIIDTPGFGDTRGIAQDKEITEKIKSFFSVKDGILGLDAVCFVVQSALAPLTQTQKYIFEAILSIFGKDIANNITIMITFADGQKPPVLEALEAADIPCVKKSDGTFLHFKFNNSALFAQTEEVGDDDENFDQMFWKMGKVSMKRFFTHLQIMETKSLQLTKEVLSERKQLEAVVTGVQPFIQTGLKKLEEIKMTAAALKQNQNVIKENENFEEALGEKVKIEKIIDQLEKEYFDVQEQLLELNDQLAKSLTRLKEIALRPDPLSTVDYIELLIESEKQTAKEGYLKRISELEELKKRALILQKVERGEALTEHEKGLRERQTIVWKLKGIYNNMENWFSTS